MTRRWILLTLIVLGFCLAASYHRGRGLVSTVTLLAVEPFDRFVEHDVDQECETMIDRRFTVDASGALNVEVGDADLVVETATPGEARIEVLLKAENMDRARRYFERLNFQVKQEGNTIVVTHDRLEGFSFSHNQTGGAHITVRAYVPQRFDASLVTSDGDVAITGPREGRLTVRTSDGDIATDDVKAPVLSLRTSDGDVASGVLSADEITLQTSDGDIAVQRAVAGQISLQTSDGNIEADEIQGAAKVVTSDGDIRLGSVAGPNVLIRTSDGEIAADQLTAERAEVITSDGNIRLDRVDAALIASTSSGNVNVALLKPADVRLRSTDGNILVTAPDNLPANLRLKGGEVRIASAYAFAGTVKEDHAEGQINGGGPLLEASTSDGVVSLEEQ